MHTERSVVLLHRFSSGTRSARRHAIKKPLAIKNAARASPRKKKVTTLKAIRRRANGTARAMESRKGTPICLPQEWQVAGSAGPRNIRRRTVIPGFPQCGHSNIGIRAGVDLGAARRLHGVRQGGGGRRRCDAEARSAWSGVGGIGRMARIGTRRYTAELTISAHDSPAHIEEPEKNEKSCGEKPQATLSGGHSTNGG